MGIERLTKVKVRLITPTETETTKTSAITT